MKRTNTFLALSSMLLCLAVPLFAGRPGGEDSCAELEYNLIVSKPDVCANQRNIPVRLKLRNISDHPLEVEPDGMFYATALDSELIDSAGNTVKRFHSLATRDPRPDSQRSFETLQPGETLQRTTNYALPIFVAGQGIHRLSFIYYSFARKPEGDLAHVRDTVKSNVILLRVRDCTPD
jgi:hypothetical protein